MRKSNIINGLLDGLAVRGNGSCKKLLSRIFMALFFLLPATGWGQPVYSDGVYYIKNIAQNQVCLGYYLWPSVVVNSTTGQRYLTTLSTTSATAAQGLGNAYDSTYSHWVVKNIDDTHFQLINARLGTYIIVRPFPKTNNGQQSNFGDRDLWLDDPAGYVDITRSYFSLHGTTDSYFISPDSCYRASACTDPEVISFNPANNDKDYLGCGGDGKTTAETGNNGNDRKGLIQLAANQPRWQFIYAPLAAPTISTVDPTTNQVTVTDNNSLPTGYNFRYTVSTDGTNPADPTASSPIMAGGQFYVEQTCIIKVVVERYGIVLTDVATQTLVPAPCATPVISFNYTTSTVSITCATASTTIYYTTDGSTPTTSSTEYSDPFLITASTTVKAIATRTNWSNSEVATLVISQVATPTIQNNGNNAISITSATPDATIYYTTDGSTPTTSSNLYTAPLHENVSGVTIKAIAVKENMITSDVGSESVTLQCEAPVIVRNDNTGFIVTCSFPASGVTIYYTTDGSTPTTSSSSTTSGGIVSCTLPVTVNAFAAASNYDNSTVTTTTVSEGMGGDGSANNPYTIEYQSDVEDFTEKANTLDGASKHYKVIATGTLDFSGVNITQPFSGTFDGGTCILTGLTNPFFNTVDGGTVKNVMLSDVNINLTSGNAGAITKVLKGTSTNKGVIYNCGILSGSVGGGTGDNDHVGGLVGDLGVSGSNDNCYARVINCFSYATITGGKCVAGIVGYNNYSTTASDIRTMVMNCMFYGDITGGTEKSPVYGGTNIDNLQGGLNTFNYYAYDQLPTSHITSGKYNCALAVEEKYLNRFEFYRLLLNSNKKLAAFYITGDANDANLLAKWVLETADRTIANPKPYPILKQQGFYPSIINPDFENAPDSSATCTNQGGKLGKTLSVTISGVGSNAPTGASITTGSLILQRTDKDFDRFNFNYDKVQLPYYNDVGTGNYTGNRVVTGWIITTITAVANDPYTSENYNYNKVYANNPEYFDYPNYNFADRKSSNKDLYSVSGRVFSQGAYFDVPYGVSSITIEPYWAKAWYIADPNYDVVYKADYSGKQNVTQTGTQVNDPQGSNPTLFNGQSVETSITRALDNIANNLGGLGSTVYDNALVLVGNLHLDVVPLNGDRPFTMMSVDTDNDHEPDYSLIYHHKNRSNITPIRFDFLAVPGTAQAQKPNGASLVCNFTIFKTRGWFEVTNTAFMYSNQLEYENGDLNGPTKINAPLILLGGIFDQFVSTQSSEVYGRTIYIHLGGNLWIDQFGMGTHSDGSKSTPHVPVSVTGGDYVGFYLTGTYNKDAAIKDDNAECYISGGRFAEMAGACQEQIGNNTTTKGNVHWQIYNADITEFFGGGINDAKPVKGNITTDIFNSRVGVFCGGPKFGNMANGKTVTTYAEGCVFGNFFGAGYGGLSYAKKKYYDATSYNWNTLQGYYTSDRGKYYDGITTGSSQISGKDYGKKGPGVATDFDYEFFVWSSGQTGARFYVKFASFSLAQCNDVESTLKKCTINENFYGGGSLGKVVGEITSILENCTVKGNVFGAGFSATLPTIEVRDAGFTTNPNFNSASGMFEPGVFSGTTTFTWQHKDDYPPNNSAGFLTDEGNYDIQNGTSVVTTVDITSSNLGSVAGAVSLTLKGNTVVGTEGVSTTGNVFGGGATSAANDNVTVTLQGETKVLSNVFGGGDQGVVGGNTTVKLQEGAQVLGNVYGGGNNGAVGGDSSVTIQDD